MDVLPFFAMFLMELKGFVYTITVNFYAYHLPFSSILPCVQRQIALHLAAKRTAFSSILHCIQRHIALYFAANNTEFGANGSFLKYIFILPAFTTNPFQPQNKSSRELIFCAQVGSWWIKMALIVLKSLLKSRQKFG